MISDVIESFVGKVFDGSGSSLGITTGVSKGQRDAIMTRDMDRKLDFVTYSEDNIIWLGTANKGTNMINIDVRQMGSPIANRETVRATEKAGGKIIGSATNVDDIVGNNKEWLGFIGETNAMNLDNGKSSRRDIDQIMSANIMERTSILSILTCSMKAIRYTI